ncbi:MAG: transcription termination/antitermination protein NusA [Anaerolineaceae bacterium]|nr:transcription termination/antitermination protein NusA [Anaerolineaceae bacterium]
MKNEFALAFNEVLEEKQLPKEIILKALESAMVSAYRRSVNASTAQEVEARVNPETGQVTIYAEKEVVETVQDERTEVSFHEAKTYDPNTEIGNMLLVESTPRDFGRVAAQTARQVIQQRIRDAERQAQLLMYEKQLGEIVSGIVQAVNAQGLTVGLEMRAEGSMARKDMIPGERFHIHDRVRALIAEVKDSPRGPQIILSRTHRDFLRRLLENEVPEIYHGIVEIRSIAREPGERAKVAVSAAQSGIDPVGACVGIRGVRIQAIVRELHDEKIDVIEWNPDASLFIAKAISPARVVGVYLNDKPGSGKTATVVVPEDQLSLAIGRDGQNARLAAKLTGWRIDIKSLTESAGDSLHKIQEDEQLLELVQVSAEQINKIQDMLARKTEGRPLNPEEYDEIGKFVDRIERRLAVKPKSAEETKAEEALITSLRASIPAYAFEQSILDSGLAEHIAYILQEAGFSTTGELTLQMKIQPDEILRLQGVGPRAMTEINLLIDRLSEEALAQPAESAEVLLEAQEAEHLEAVAPVDTPETEVETLVASEMETLPAEAVEEEVEIPLIQEVTEEVEEEDEEEEGVTFDKLFTLNTGVITETADGESGEEMDETELSKSKKKKKKRKHVEVEYDPDRDMTIVHKKHKRGAGWPDDWTF